MKHIKISSVDNQSSLRIAVVVSRYNQDITFELMNGAITRLQELNIEKKDITVVEVPGAVEIPLVCKKLASKKSFDAIITLGAVIRGETTHYDYVCEMVSSGCKDISLQFELPVIFGVLTTENVDQAWDRLGGTRGHKGKDAADAAVEMHYILKEL